MNKYRIVITVIEEYVVDIDADTEQEACNIVDDMIGDYTATNDPEYRNSYISEVVQL